MTSTNGSSTRNFVPMQSKYDRVVLLVDMDCFYCQVEEKLEPSYKGQPLAVVQYNAWRGGGIIAVNYAARAKGVTRHMRGDEAKQQCPDIVLVKVPNVREKADLSKYREAGKDVANVLQRYTQLLERASVDEAYLDITETVNKRLESLNAGAFVLQPQELVNTYAVGYADIGEYVSRITSRFANPYMDDEKFLRNHDYNDLPAVRQSDIRLLIGASIAGEIRAAVKSVTGYECSAGIAHNKILAKLACGINKPNKQTILPLAEISVLFETLPVSKIKGLGGKFGEDVCERLKIKYLGQILKFTEAELQRKFDDKNGSWLYNISRGIDLEAVTPRFYSKSIGCCKKFPGRNNITGIKTLQHWLNELANEIYDRLEKDIIENNRKAKQMVVSYIQEFEGEEISSSRSVPLSHYDQDSLAKYALEVIKSNTKTFFRPGSETVINNAIKFLGISVGKFETISSAQTRLQDMFANHVAKKRRVSNDTNQVVESNTAKTEEKPKASEETKMKSFFENYLQSNKNGGGDAVVEKISQAANASPKLNEPSKSKAINSYFMTALQKHKENIENSNVLEDQKEVETSKVKVPTTLGDPPSNSFFAKYILKDANETTDNDTKDADQRKVNKQETEVTQLTEKNKNLDASKSYFLKILQQQNESKEVEILKSPTKDICTEAKITPPTKAGKKLDASKSFFLEILPELKETEAIDPNVKDDFELQLLAAELGEMESSNEKADELCKDILKLGETKECLDYTFDTTNLRNSTHIEVPSLKRKLEVNNSETTGDFKKNYVEYAVPDLVQNLLTFVKCEQCGAKIPDDARSQQTHQDHHLAQQLSQQQRLEYRSELQSKMQSTVKTSPNGSNGKKQKKANNNTSNNSSTMTAKTTTTTKQVGDITKFLKAKTAPRVPPELNDEPTTSAAAAAAAEPMELCAECQTYVKVSELGEHMDFHVAKQLQRKLNQLEVRTVAIVKKSSGGAAGKKQQHNTSAMLNNSTRSVNKTIAQFFTQTN